jgi:hypothetical protein
MVKVKRMMETDDNGVQRQFYPMTDVSAIKGLQKIITGGSQVISVNGKTGAVIITKDDLGLTNAITKLPYANYETDGIITADTYNKISELTAIVGPASSERLGYIKVGELLNIADDGTLSAKRQSDFNFSEELKSKLESLKSYTAGANISISEDGVISATGGNGDGGSGVNQEYVDQGDQNTLAAAKAYTDSLKNFIFEKVGEI